LAAARGCSNLRAKQELREIARQLLCCGIDLDGLLPLVRIIKAVLSELENDKD
jgi:hypothetical protein